MRAAGSVEQEQTARMCKADHDLHSHENKSKIANVRIGLILSKARPCFNVSTCLLKTLWEKEQLLFTSNCSFSYSVFDPFGELSAIFIKFKMLVNSSFLFGREDLNFITRERNSVMNDTIKGTTQFLDPLTHSQISHGFYVSAAQFF